MKRQKNGDIINMESKQFDFIMQVLQNTGNISCRN